MAEQQHVWGPWTNYTPSQQRRQCIRCGAYQYRPYGVQPG